LFAPAEWPDESPAIEAEGHMIPDLDIYRAAKLLIVDLAGDRQRDRGVARIVRTPEKEVELRDGKTRPSTTTLRYFFAVRLEFSASAQVLMH
jgi:hypothetical protein